MSWTHTITQLAGKAGLVEVEDHVEAPAQAAPAPREATQYPPAPKPVPQPPTDPDNALLKKLCGNVFQTTEAFVRFASLQESLRPEISDERQRWRVSFKASGLTRQALDASIQNCRSYLNAEVDKFATSLKSNRTNDLQAKQEQARILSAQAESKRAELKALESQYADIVADVAQTTSRLDAVEAQFKEAVSSLKSELDANAVNITAFLPDLSGGK